MNTNPDLRSGRRPIETRAFSDNRERYFWQSRGPRGTPAPELTDLRALARAIRRSYL